MKNIIIILLSVLVLALSGYLLYDSLNGEMSQAQIKSQFNDLKADYQNMQRDMQSKVGSLNISNKVIQMQQQKLEMLFKKNTISEEELVEAKKIMKSISQSVLDEYQKKVSALESEKGNLETDMNILESKNIISEKELNQLNIKITNLEKAKTELNSKYIFAKKETENKETLLSTASYLALSNFVMRSFKIRSNGKEVETDKASRIDRIKVSFDIIKNVIADSGDKEFYIIVKRPDGTAATFTNKTPGTFKLNGVDTTYSDKVTVNYTKGEEKNIELVWDSEDFARGNYLIEVYEKTKNGTEKTAKATKTLD